MKRLPLFVLPTVLFPGSLLPLHVFEPRYRQMAARCLETDMRFGVLYHDSETMAPFRVEEGGVGCEAEIMQFQPLPDGRSLMLTRGLGRFRVLDGIESATQYHEAVVEEYDDVEPAAHDLSARRRRSIALYRSVLRQKGVPTSESTIDDARDVSFQIAQSFHDAAGWQQSLLEMRSEEERLDEIDRMLASYE